MSSPTNSENADLTVPAATEVAEPTAATEAPQAAGLSPLEAAAQAGPPLSWPEDPDVDPEGAPDPTLPSAAEEQDLISFNLRH